MLALVLAAASLGAAGCNEYHYYDVDVTFDTSSGQFAGINEISTIQVMRMLVGGADNADVQIGPNANGPYVFKWPSSANALYASLKGKTIHNPSDAMTKEDAQGIIRTVEVALDSITTNDFMGYAIGSKGFI